LARWRREAISQDKYLGGEKRLLLAVIEPSAGSNIRDINSEVGLSKDRKTFTLNDQKKWFTGGMLAAMHMLASQTLL